VTGDQAGWKLARGLITVYIYSMSSHSTNPPPSRVHWLRDADKGRGTGLQISHRFDPLTREAFDDGWAAEGISDATGAKSATVVSEEISRSILSKNDSPDIGFDLSINPYRGCEHGCIYCYARPTHSYLNLSPGRDFEEQIVAKIQAAQLLRQALSKPSYRPLALNVGSVTDAYQPVERRLRLTRSVMEVLVEYRHAFSVITKSALVLRDLDLIAPMAAAQRAAVYVSLTTLDPSLARVLEPRAAAPHRRLQVIRALTEAGIPVGVSVSPVIPFINEPELEHILEAAAAAGASSAFSVVLRLPWEVRPLFEAWLAQHFPDRASRVLARLRDMREGKLNDSAFGTRMTGTGVWAQLLRQRFEKACARLGLSRTRYELDLSSFRRSGSAAVAQRDLRSGRMSGRSRPQPRGSSAGLEEVAHLVGPCFGVR
jgi:DNA repair photolyase